MPEDVHVPGLGNMDKKKAALIVGGVVVIGGIAYYRYKKSGGSSTATDTTATASNIDPATGYEYGSPEDLNALALQQQESASGGAGGGGIVDPNGTNVPNQTTSFVDNAHWEQAAVAYLSGIGESATKVSAALGKYLAGQPVTDAERTIIDQAIAAENMPPIAGPSGYPPHIKAAPPTPPSTPKLATPHIAIVSRTKSHATFHWAAIKHAERYEIRNARGTFRDVTPNTRFTVPRPGIYWIVATASGYRDSDRSNKLSV